MELEVYKKSDFYEDYIDSQKEYYERTNADAYFAERLAEKDKEIAMLKDKANYNEYAYKHKSEELADTCRFYEKELRHHKYKRCLDKAKWCKDKMDAIQNGYIRIESQNGVMTTCPPGCNPKFSFYFKWQNRWHELAEKFKESK